MQSPFIPHGKSFTLKAFGNSMYPLLHDGDVVTYKKTLFTKLVENDLVLIKQKNKFITHRIVYKTKTYVVTKGDSNPEADGKVKPVQILGKIVSVKRAGKSFDPEALYLMQSTLYFQEIVRIKAALEKQNIEYVFLKGLPVHLYYEKTHPRRFYLDADILVRRENFTALKKLLIKNGYKKANTELSSEAWWLKNNLVPEVSFTKVVHGMRIVFDIHFEAVFLLTKLGNLNALYHSQLVKDFTDYLFITKQKVIIQGEEFNLLSKEAQLVYLCLHFFHHNFRGIFRLQFIQVVLESKSLKWNMVRYIVNSFYLENFVDPALKLAKSRDFGLDIFSDASRVEGGISRFLTIYKMSPYPWYRKIFVFFEPQVILTIAWVLWKKIAINRSLQKT